MSFKSKRIPLVILGITAIICSRTMLVSLNDPEGPNLLVVMVGAVIIYFLSLAIYLFKPLVERGFKGLSLFSLTDPKRFLLIISLQIFITTTLYLCLN